MKKNPGRKNRRDNEHMAVRRKGDLNRKSTHRMRSNSGMASDKDNSMLRKLLGA